MGPAFTSRPLDPIYAAPLKPHMIVESSPGRYHAYWLIEGATLDQFTPVQRALAGRFGADKSVVDLCRVMRLPGFIHRKGEPFMTRVIEEEVCQPYDASEFLSKFEIDLSTAPIMTDSSPGPKLGTEHDPVLKALDEQGLHRHRVAGEPGKHAILCPWRHEHTTGDDGTVYYEAHTNGYGSAAFKCQHTHCAHRTIRDLRTLLGVPEDVFELYFPVRKAERQESVHAAANDELLFNLEEARAGRFTRHAPPRMEFVVEPLLPCGKLASEVAPGGVGKSTFSLQIGVAVATATPLCGYWTVSRPGGVLILAAEDAEDDLHRRIHAIIHPVGDPVKPQSRMTYSADHIRLLDERLFVKPVVGMNNRLTAKVGGSLQRTAYVQRLVNTAAEIPDLSLIIIDPLASFNGGEENANEDMNFLIDALRHVVAETGAAVLVLHHASKSSMRDGAGAEQYAARGASALTDGVRLQLNLTLMNWREAKYYGVPLEEACNYVRLTVAKSNYAPSKYGVWLRRGIDGVLDHADFSDLEETKDEARFQEFVKTAQGIITAEAQKGNELSKSKLIKHHGGAAGKLGLSDKKLRSMLDRAIAEGHLALRAPREKQRNVAEVLYMPDSGDEVELSAA